MKREIFNLRQGIERWASKETNLMYILKCYLVIHNRRLQLTVSSEIRIFGIQIAIQY